MSAFLFTINKAGTAILDEDAVKLAPKLGKLKTDEVLFVILFTDYASPYNQLPESERLIRSVRHVWGKDGEKKAEAKHIRDAIDEYDGLQYDPDRELLRNYRAKITQYSEDILNETNARNLKALDDAISVLQARCDKMIEKLERRDEQDFVLKGNKQLSKIERWQASMREKSKAKRQSATIAATA